MLILGIETATVQVGLRHRRPRRRARHRSTRPGAGATPRRSTPAIEFVCQQARVELERDRRGRRRHRPGPVHRAARRRRHGQGHGPGAARADDRRRRASTCSPSRVRYTDRLIVAASSTPGGARCSTRSTARCPAACSGCRPYQVGDARRPGVGAAGHAARTACSSATARSATRDVFDDVGRVELGDGRACAYPSAAVARGAGPPPRAARGVRAAVGARAAVPAQARRRDQLGHAASRRTMARTRAERRADPTSSRCSSCPMRRRHLRSVLRIEAQVYPRPWSLSLFMSELALRTQPRLRRGPRRRRRSSATPG